MTNLNKIFAIQLSFNMIELAQFLNSGELHTFR